jgi:hypothetical protein
VGSQRPLESLPSVFDFMARRATAIRGCLASYEEMATHALTTGLMKSR